VNDLVVKIEGVTKRFRDKVAVRDLDLEIPRGSVCGFLGPNGAGKTTTIRMVMGIFYPDEGSIDVLGKRSATESRDLVGYLPEERGVYRKMKVFDFLAYIARLKNVPAGEIRQRIDSWLERIDLPGVQKKKCEELSKGMQQKVQFIATVIHDPDLVILDEPFSGLDPVNSRLLRELIDDLRDCGKTIIFSTHVLHSAEQICDRVFMINQGRKVLDGPVDAVRERFNPRTVVAEPIDGRADGLERMGGVDRVTPPGKESPGYELHLSDGADTQAVMRELVSIAPMRRVELRRASLEDIFIELVQPGDSEDTVRAQLGRAEAAGVQA